MGTSTLARQLLTDLSFRGVITDALGTNSGDYTDVEVGKGVKLAASAYVPVVKADEIDGIVATVEPGLRNGGFNWGTIQTKGRALATVGASQTGNVAIGAYVTNDTPIAPLTAGLIQVFSVGTGFVAPTRFFWRVIKIISGTGAAGDSVMIERI